MVEIYIGVDAGTSGCKAVALGTGGHVLASAWAGYPTIRTEQGGVLQDPADWDDAVRTTVAQVVAQVGGASVMGMSLTAPAHNVVLVDADGEPVTPVVLWSDPRPTAVLDRVRRELGEKISTRALVDLGPGWSLVQLVWLRTTHAVPWARVRWVLPAKDYLRLRLTGVAATDPSDAAGTALYDQLTGAWLPAAVQLAGLRPTQLPDIRSSTVQGGRLRAEWARSVGLPVGVPVAIGATDTAAELVSVDAVRPGTGVVKVASTGTVVAVGSQKRRITGLLVYPHAIDGLTYTLGATNTAATAHRWLRERVFGADPDNEPADLHCFETAAAKVGPGAEGLLFLPFLDGERCPYDDPLLRGAFLGLTARHERGHLLRALMEGVAFSLRGCRDALATAGVAPHDVCLTGGGLRSPLWRSIVTAVLDLPARYLANTGPALGAARLAAFAAAGHPLDEWPGDAVEHVMPEPQWVTAYAHRYPIYEQAVAALAPVAHTLAASQANSQASPS